MHTLRLSNNTASKNKPNKHLRKTQALHFHREQIPVQAKSKSRPKETEYQIPE
jgi:hypothetical protein